MNLNDPALLIGVSIISELHQDFADQNNDDRDHINNLWSVIKGVSGYLKTTKMPKTQRQKIIDELKKYGKKLWIDSCVKQSEDIESEQEIREESDYLFDYIFKNHDYPD